MEIWKDIIGFEGLYKVSDLGKVYSYPRTIDGANGGTRSHNGLELSPDRGELSTAYNFKWQYAS